MYHATKITGLATVMNVVLVTIIQLARCPAVQTAIHLHAISQLASVFTAAVLDGTEARAMAYAALIARTRNVKI